jgi:hypothetical protein
MLKFKNLSAIILFSTFTLISCSEDKSTILGPEDPEVPFETRLFDLDGVTITALGASDGFENIYQIDISQPVDHNNPNGQQFTQRLYLSHRDENLPMVIETSGYHVTSNRLREVNEIINSNNIIVSHRYYPNSSPEPKDWQYLTAYQEASDYHRIYELFSTIYDSSWISTGISKGGQTALLYKKYYPNDVDAVVAYVAPITDSPQDPTIGQFLSTLGDEGCYQSIIDLQRYCIANRDSLIPYAQNVYDSLGYTISDGIESGLLHQILEYPIMFWQYSPSDCAAIPDSNTSYQEIFDYLQSQIGIQNYSDQYNEYYAPTYYQVFSENGYYSYPIDSLTDALTGLDVPQPPDLLLSNISTDFNPNTTIELRNFLNTEGNNIIYVYGGNDPWTAYAYEPTGSTNAIKIIQPGYDHSVKIINLDDKSLVYNALEEWLGITLNRL